MAIFQDLDSKDYSYRDSECPAWSSENFQSTKEMTEFWKVENEENVGTCSEL